MLLARLASTAASVRFPSNGPSAGKSLPSVSAPASLLPHSDVYGSVPNTIEIREKHPNGTREEAQEIQIPAIATGAIDHPGSTDYFSFRVKPEEALAFEI